MRVILLSMAFIWTLPPVIVVQGGPELKTKHWTPAAFAASAIVLPISNSVGPLGSVKIWLEG